MIKIILILALLQYLYYFIFKPKLNTLNCGIFGEATNNPTKLEIASVNILGIYNIERGKQSCGLTWDGEIHHGIDGDKLYTDFIKGRNIKPKSFPTIFGHTRQASFGNGINLENAHPFGFGESKDGQSFEFIFVHNGTLKNHKDLAKKYEIETTVKYQKKHLNTEGTYEATREKIDSEILGEILWKTKSYHVLSDYIGTAACAWMWCDEPNKVYLWSGASKKHVDDEIIDNKIFEERPLCVFPKSKNNLFFSSIDESLTAIGGTVDTVEQIQVNHVHVITNGDYKNCEKIRATRINAGQDDSYRYKATAPRQNHSGYKSQAYFDHISDDGIDYSNFNCSVKNRHDYNDAGLDMWEDKPLYNVNSYTGRAYSRMLRYWKNGHVINGIHVYIPNYGFKFVADDYTSALTNMNEAKGKVFVDGDWSRLIKEGDIPFKKDAGTIQFHYFIDGALLRSHGDYITCQNLKKNLTGNSKYIDTNTLSFMTKHPIVSMMYSKKPVALYEGKVFTGNSVELGFEKVYYFNNGKYVKFNKREDLVKAEASVIQLPISFKKVETPTNTDGYDPKVEEEAVNKIKAYEKEWEDQLEREMTGSIVKDHFEKELNEELNSPEEEMKDFVGEFIAEEFSDIINRCEKFDEDLQDFIKNPLALEASRTLNLVTNALKDFILIPKEVKK